MTEKESKLFKQLQSVAQKYSLQCMAIYDFSGGCGWINYKRVDDNDYAIQLSMPDDFDKYMAARDEICKVFSTVASVLVSEEPYGDRRFGFQRELFFVDNMKWDEIQKEKKQNMSTQTTNIGTQINGDILTSEGNINTGNAETINNGAIEPHREGNWLSKEVAKMILSFIAGVMSTLVGQWLLRIIGWI